MVGAIDIQRSGSIMSLAQGPAPSPAGGSAESDTDALTEGARLAARLREDTNRRVNAGEMSIIDADLHFELADFCEKYGVIPCHDERDWFGFGTVTVLFNDPDGGYWVPLGDVHRVSGTDWEQLKSMFFEELAEDTGEVAELSWLIDDEGNRSVVPLAEHGFCMRAMIAGPWSKEWSDNLTGVFQRAALSTGLAAKVGPVVAIGEDGRATMTEISLVDMLSAGGVPTEVEARERAMRGPLGGGL